MFILLPVLTGLEASVAVTDSSQSKQAEESRYPAVVLFAAYSHELQQTGAPTGTNETGSAAVLADRGYNHVVVSRRGMGRSQAEPRLLGLWAAASHPRRSLLVTKGDDRIDPHCSTRGYVTGERGYGGEKQRTRRIGERIEGAGVNKKAREKSRKANGKYDANTETHQHQLQSLSENDAENVLPLGAEHEADTDFVGALAGAI